MIRLEITEKVPVDNVLNATPRIVTLLVTERDCAAGDISLSAILAAFTKAKRVRRPRESRGSVSQ